MGRLEDAVRRVADDELREEILSALGELKRRRNFGLVYEEHIPETTDLLGFPIRPGSIVARRDHPHSDAAYVVESADRDTARITPVAGEGRAATVGLANLLAVKRFGEPVYPSLTMLGQVKRGASDRPHHAVINAENYHALQLALYMYEGQVDCIYIDPPYNNRESEWKYNNDYVDKTDSWRHSKWLSFMEKRLRLARRLLRPDGVLIVTIDEHELYHLGMLLEEKFPDCNRYKLTIVVTASGNTGDANFGAVDEQALFCVPKSDVPLVSGDPVEEEGYWDNARRRGGLTSYRAQRWRQFYPIYIDEKKREIVRIGDKIPLNEDPAFASIDGLRPIWPIDSRGLHRCWAYSAESMRAALANGNLELGRHNRKADTWTIRLYRVRTRPTPVKSVWNKTDYSAGTHGTEVLNAFMGRPGLFPYPKSIYAVRDCLATVVRNRPDALIVDFFAGSGTTLHATCLLNAVDGGTRRCILVTNNEVGAADARAFHRRGVYRGDAEYEASGIYELVTRPRCEAVVTGIRPDGQPVAGVDKDGRPFANGFQENVSFFRMDYLDPNEVDLGRQFNAIHPILWLSAGGQGEQGTHDDLPFLIPDDSNYAVLFRESRFGAFRKALESRPDISAIWLVTDSEEAFAEMRQALPGRMKASMLYHDYLHNFRVNTE